MCRMIFFGDGRRFCRRSTSRPFVIAAGYQEAAVRRRGKAMDSAHSRDSAYDLVRRRVYRNDRILLLENLTFLIPQHKLSLLDLRQ